jgi:hypothetical protein
MRKMTVVAAACCALVLAGTAAALSPSRYRAQANAICLDLHRKVDRLQDPKGRKDVLPYLKRGLAIAEPAAARLRRLVPPPSLAADHARVNRLIAQQDVLLRQVIAKLQAGADPEETINAADPKLTKLANQEDATWRRMRIAECAKRS